MLFKLFIILASPLSPLPFSYTHTAPTAISCWSLRDIDELWYSCPCRLHLHLSNHTVPASCVINLAFLWTRTRTIKLGCLLCHYVLSYEHTPDTIWRLFILLRLAFFSRRFPSRTQFCVGITYVELTYILHSDTRYRVTHRRPTTLTYLTRLLPSLSHL